MACAAFVIMDIRMLDRRIAIFTALPIRSLDQLSLQARLREIGRMQDAVERA